jgi:capsular polysaccharide biosynthesis protein
MISDLTNAQALGLPILRHLVVPAAGGIQPLPLISGTECFAQEWLVNWHREHHHWPESDMACYSITNAVVSGAGQIWLDGQLITSPEIMPPYVAQGLDIANGGNEMLRGAGALPVRTIETPCLVAIGHGIRVYGHFLIELLFRILAARRAYQTTGLRYRVLLDQAAPEWLLRILDEYLEVRASDIEFFQPEKERVQLHHAIISTTPLRDERFHPATNEMLAALVDRLNIPCLERPLRRVFIGRSGFSNPAAPNRTCVNEQNLIDTAVADYGFTSVAIETMSWSQQIALFREAEIVLGVAGSGLHNALFSHPGSRLGSIGVMNLVQSQIGALRGQHNAFLSKDIKLSGRFQVDEETYQAFLERVCA